MTRLVSAALAVSLALVLVGQRRPRCAHERVAAGRAGREDEVRARRPVRVLDAGGEPEEGRRLLRGRRRLLRPDDVRDRQPVVRRRRRPRRGPDVRGRDARPDGLAQPVPRLELGLHPVLHGRRPPRRPARQVRAGDRRAARLAERALRPALGVRALRRRRLGVRGGVQRGQRRLGLPRAGRARPAGRRLA